MLVFDDLALIEHWHASLAGGTRHVHGHSLAHGAHSHHLWNWSSLALLATHDHSCILSLANHATMHLVAHASIFTSVALATTWGVVLTSAKPQHWDFSPTNKKDRFYPGSYLFVGSKWKPRLSVDLPKKLRFLWYWHIPSEPKTYKFIGLFSEHRLFRTFSIYLGFCLKKPGFSLKTYVFSLWRYFNFKCLPIKFVIFDRAPQGFTREDSVAFKKSNRIGKACEL